jgi:hypothetical protein
MNNFDPEQIASAYRYLANSDPNVVSDESLITVYNHLINYCGSPLPARQALLIIAWTRSSEELLQAVNNEGATFEQAVAYFGVALDTPSTEIGRLVGMYMNSDGHVLCENTKLKIMIFLAIIAVKRGDFQLMKMAIRVGESSLDDSVTENMYAPIVYTHRAEH